MSYQTYTTDALVCGTYDRNTADRSYRLFTRELGMLYADARSVRLEKSRQRMALSDFSLIRVSLVRGKSGWKIGSITSIKNYYHNAANQAARGSVVNIVRLLRRYVQGEEVDANLFKLVQSSLEVLSMTTEERLYVERVVTVRILALLGYVSERVLPRVVMSTNPADLASTYDPAIADRLQIVQQAAELSSHL